MAATRLSDSQKTELVGRFREGSSSQELAESFGCSPNTVIRVVRSELRDEAYERLKAERSRRRSRLLLPVESAEPPGDLQTGLTISSPELSPEPPLEPAALEPIEEPETAPVPAPSTEPGAPHTATARA
jgi:hypothetical protein